MSFSLLVVDFTNGMFPPSKDICSDSEEALASDLVNKAMMFHPSIVLQLVTKKTLEILLGRSSLMPSLFIASRGVNFVNEITPAKESWNIDVRVVRLWFVPDMNVKQKYFAMETVLMDDKGDKI
ncbi:unnamed protein product [Vicia faba]|uniref:Replication protein A 70 kDa DNA-binding subunit B/D first OB fold domain-containing protein n=1 Tax=Vicia faba TaxID=3906 RepID=A0AAV0ZN02_VICFA|nr:unnamed protein product [Vicia faba]